jgi:hypothetical protein
MLMQDGICSMIVTKIRCTEVTVPNITNLEYFWEREIIRDKEENFSPECRNLASSQYESNAYPVIYLNRLHERSLKYAAK